MWCRAAEGAPERPEPRPVLAAYSRKLSEKSADRLRRFRWALLPDPNNRSLRLPDEEVGLHGRRGPHAPRGRIRPPPPGPGALGQLRGFGLAPQPDELGPRPPAAAPRAN